MKKVLGVLLIITSIVGGLYVGGWLMFVQPIISACKAFDTNTLTATIAGWTIVKCVLASLVGGIIAWAGCTVGGILTMIDDVSGKTKFKRR